MADEKTLIDWLSIRLAADMTRPRFYNLMERFATPAAVFAASPREIAAGRGFDQKLALGILGNRGSADVHAHADKLDKSGIRVITRDDPDYPINLAQSNLHPPLLFVKGQILPEDKYSIAMVGSRHATQYGRGVAREISGGLARCGMTIISGFARGVDGESHNAALKAGGRTLAVLGNGMDVCYPSEHHSLVEKVAASGALITEYPLGTPPERFNFPERNHVIAALALATVVVEAAEKSGSLITARLAVEENRFIFAVPGDITRNNSRGANGLIQQGARMIQRPRDVLIEMKEMLRGYLNEELLEEEAEPVTAPKRSSSGREPSSRSSPAVVPEPNDLLSVVALADDQTSGSHVALASASARAASKPALTEDEQYVVDLLHHEAMVFDELAEQAYSRGMDVPRLSSILMKLELRQVIRQLPGRYYVLFV